MAQSLPMPSVLVRLALAAALAASALATLAAQPTPAAAAGPVTLYVDGKHGNDGDSGLSWGDALKSISVAARKVPRGTSGAGWHVVVRGYADYLYRERPIPGGWNRNGVAGSPIVFEAEGWSPGGTDYIRPIVSGGVSAPGAGKDWLPTASAGVWYASWASKPRNFVGAGTAYDTALFQNTTTWLWQRPSLADLRSSPKAGGFWYDATAKRLYVAPKGGGDPNGMSIEVPTNNGFYFSGDFGGSWVEVRGFTIQHAAMAVAFVAGVDHSSAVDNIAQANNHIGFHTDGRNLSSGYDPAVGNRFLRNTGSYNTVQAFKIGAGTQDSVVCDNTAARNALQGIKVQGAVTSGDHRVTRDIVVCRNLVHHQTFARPDRAYENTTGITIANGARNVNVHHNDVWANNIGIHVTQQGGYGAPIVGLRVSRNRIWGNQRFGLDTRDGQPDPADGIGSMTSSYNLYWGNDVGILVGHGSKNKTFVHDTVQGNRTAGIKVGCGCSSSAASATVKQSLVTSNGTYGIQVLGRGRAYVSYTGLAGNRSGAISGSASKTAINTRGVGYLSMDPGHVDFLRIGPTSFQYTAGPNGSPIGARY